MDPGKPAVSVITLVYPRKTVALILRRYGSIHIHTTIKRELGYFILQCFQQSDVLVKAVYVHHDAGHF